MNDWYNDPPDDEVPEVNCPKCGEPADFVRDEKTGTVFACTACVQEWLEEFPVECFLPFADEPDFSTLEAERHWVSLPCPPGEFGMGLKCGYWARK